MKGKRVVRSGVTFADEDASDTDAFEKGVGVIGSSGPSTCWPLARLNRPGLLPIPAKQFG